MKKVFILLLGLGFLRMYAQNVGIGTAVPTEKLHVAGNLRFDGALMPNNNAGTAGQVLVSQGAGAAPIWQTPAWAKICATASTNFVQKWTGTELCNTIIQDNGVTVGINAAPQANDITYVFAPSTHRGAGKSALRAYRTATGGATNGGTSWSAFGVDVALKAYNVWGNAYSAALGVYGYTDYANSAVAVFGDRNSTSDTWIGYRDADNRRWGVYSNGIARFYQRLFVEDPNITGGGLTNLDKDKFRFVVQTPGRPFILVVDQVDTVVRIGRGTGALSGDNTIKCLDGFTEEINYFVDIDGGDASGQVLGVGSVEYLVDGLAHLFVSHNFSPVRSSCTGAQPWINLGSTSNRWRTIYLQNAPDIASDRRLKRNIQPLSYGLQTVMQLNPVSYQWKEEVHEIVPDDEVMLGFISQEVHEVIPEIVRTHHYKWKDESQQEVVKNQNEILGIRYTELIPVLVKAIQEQQQQIEELQKEIEKLKSTQK